MHIASPPRVHITTTSYCGRWHARGARITGGRQRAVLNPAKISPIVVFFSWKKSSQVILLAYPPWLRVPYQKSFGTAAQSPKHTTSTSIFYENIYWKVIYVYPYESNFQDKYIYMIFTFSNLMTQRLFMIYIPINI
jgi:hypothetical protein